MKNMRVINHFDSEIYCYKMENCCSNKYTGIRTVNSSVHLQL